MTKKELLCIMASNIVAAYNGRVHRVEPDKLAELAVNVAKSIIENVDYKESERD